MPTVIGYHGSPKRFDQFRPGLHKPTKQLGFGIHFTVSPDFAAKYGRYVHKVRLTYTRELDTDQIAEKGTPEFDLAIALFRGGSRAHMGVYFKDKGVSPINLDIAAPAKTVKLLREFGFDLVKYNAVVTRAGSGLQWVRVGDAPSYAVLDPGQIEVLEVVDQGKGAAKEWNPAQNPDWSRESMKTILAWGWMSPTGQDHVGRRKDGTHDRMADDLGLGTWTQAVKSGWVRYILFTDGHMGLTLIPVPATLAAAKKLVGRPDVVTVSFEWMVDESLEQSGVLTAKEALVAIRARERVQNPTPQASYTREQLERLDIDTLDRMAYGLAAGDTTTVSPSQIGIKYPGDLLNPQEKFAKGGMGWARSVDFSEPVSVSVGQQGKLSLEDGHHRWFAAKKLGRKITAVVEKVQGKPIEYLLGNSVKGVRNPVYYGDLSGNNLIPSWGFIHPNGMDVLDGRDPKWTRGTNSHDKLAKAAGYGSEAKMIKQGWVRFILQTRPYTQVDATIGTPWVKGVATLKKWISSLPSTTLLVNMDFTASDGKQVDDTLGVYGEKQVKSALAALIRGEEPNVVAKRIHKAEVEGREINPPMGLRRQNLLWGLMSPDGKVWQGKPGEEEHYAIALRALGRKDDGYGSALDELISKGWIRFVVDSHGSLWAEIHNRDKKLYATLIKLIDRPEVVGTVTVDLQQLGKTIEFESAEEAVRELRAYNRTANPLTLTPTHQRQARDNKFNILVFMSPLDFLRLTTVDDAQAAETIATAQPLSVYNQAADGGNNIIPCFLTLDISTGAAKITGHEGRHRAAALISDGEKGAVQPVYLRIQDSHPRQAAEMLSSLPGGAAKWQWDTTYLWGWDELPEILVGQFRPGVRVLKSSLKVVEPYVQERARKARGL